MSWGAVPNRSSAVAPFGRPTVIRTLVAVAKRQSVKSRAWIHGRSLRVHTFRSRSRNNDGTPSAREPMH